MRVLFANVSERSHDFDQLVEVIDRANADVAVLAEVDADAMAHLRLRLPAYRHHLESTIGPRPLGMAILSRRPLSSPRIVTLDEGSAPAILAHVEGLARPLAIIGVHPLPPYRPSWYARRNAYLDRLAGLVEQQKGELVVVGDFNITPWADHYRRFVERTDLRDSGSGFGLHTTWPSFLPALLRIPIDHCFISPGVAVVDRRVLGSMGSDHLPIVVDLEL